MLHWRLAVAAAIILPALGLMWLDVHWNFDRPGIWMVVLALLATSLATEEVLDLLHARELRPIGWIVHIGTAGVIFTTSLPIVWGNSPLENALGRFGLPMLAVAGTVLLAFYGELRRYHHPGVVIVHVALTLFVVVYIGVLMSFLVQLRSLFAGSQTAWGVFAIFSMIWVVKLSDAGAYFVGRALGRHKLTPRVSPGKTVEGSIGGFLFACAGSWFVCQVLAPWLMGASAAPRGWPAWLGYGLTLALVGMLGDLSESMLKRDMDRKDSSSWMPGLGGVMDVLDSLLFAAPVAYVWWLVGWVGPR